MRSKSSSIPEFLKAVKPKIALIGVGKNNLFGHPSDITINNLKKEKIKIFRTDENGEITLRLNKENIKIDTINQCEYKFSKNGNNKRKSGGRNLNKIIVWILVIIVVIMGITMAVIITEPKKEKIAETKVVEENNIVQNDIVANVQKEEPIKEANTNF